MRGYTKNWARSVQPFWRLLDTNKQTDKQKNKQTDKPNLYIDSPFVLKLINTMRNFFPKFYFHDYSKLFLIRTFWRNSIRFATPWRSFKKLCWQSRKIRFLLTVILSWADFTASSWEQDRFRTTRFRTFRLYVLTPNPSYDPPLLVNLNISWINNLLIILDWNLVWFQQTLLFLNPTFHKKNFFFSLLVVRGRKFVLVILQHCVPC